jgi:hypothetical protein
LGRLSLQHPLTLKYWASSIVLLKELIISIIPLLKSANGHTIYQVWQHVYEWVTSGIPKARVTVSI